MGNPLRPDSASSLRLHSASSEGRGRESELVSQPRRGTGSLPGEKDSGTYYEIPVLDGEEDGSEEGS